MTALTWDGTGSRFYELGTDHGVLYPCDTAGAYQKGVAWNGLTAVTETPDGAEANDMYADNIKYASVRSAETFGGTIEAYMYPDEWNQCDGSIAPAGAGVIFGQQTRNKFGLAYRTKIGNDVTDTAGYKLHLVYGATASPSERGYETRNDSPEGITFSWEFTTDPVAIEGHPELNPVSLITIDSTKVNSAKLAAFEDILYGTEDTEPKLPTPAEVLSAFPKA